MSSSNNKLREFIKHHIYEIFKNKEYLTRILYMNIYTKIYDFCTNKISVKKYLFKNKSRLYIQKAAVNKSLDFILSFIK